MTAALRTLYRYWVTIILLAVIVQIGAAGYGAFYADTKVGHNTNNTITQKQFDHGFGAHIALGYLILLASILLLLLALAARPGRTRILQTLALPLLVILQVVLGVSGGSTPAVGALHPVNALLILGLAGYLARQAWQQARQAPRAATTVPAPG